MFGGSRGHGKIKQDRRMRIARAQEDSDQVVLERSKGPARKYLGKGPLRAVQTGLGVRREGEWEAGARRARRPL